ncbi:carbohydrate ABC transporter permease [Nocardioides panaciterrulae]|uniref:Multiple sugar transport system permease protein n=1 Tax=Nocardioides panaciterrulae TaxID=661492 RepID=A0A7Y9E9E4_9ACTN|nr:sugar ABC transporter permease [Nocardioides panaciterrulae]NYD43321.1 multiple sugar transport system permease protein [Nocardioides panaciterrulae]
MAEHTASRGRTARGDGAAALVFLSPFLVLAVVFILYPVGQALYMSFFDFDLLTQTATNFGLQNYREMFGGSDLTWSATSMLTWRIPLLLLAGAVVVRGTRRPGAKRTLTVVAVLLLLVVALGVHPGAHGSWNDQRFWAALQHTIEFTVISTPLLMALGLGLAILVNRPGRLSTVYRTAFFLPYVLPVSVVTLIWIYLLNPDRGLAVKLTDALGIPPIDYLNSPSFALPAVILTTIWWTVGFNLVLFLAGLQDIDPHLYEAAALDGASRWASFVNITVPGLRRVSMLVLVTQVVASFQVFGQVYIMTRGGPGDSSLVLIQNVYQTGIRDAKLGYASAQSIVLLALILVVSLVELRFLREDADS